MRPFNPPALVFMADGEEQACHAFRVGAIDYLMKPLDPGRLREAVERAIVRVRGLQSSEVNQEGAPDSPQRLARPSHPLLWLPSSIGLLEREPKTAMIPVVVVTSLEDPAAEQAARSLGADAFLRKPASFDDVHAALRSALLLDNG